MTVPLAHDRSADILGVDTNHSGLHCRFQGCREHWDVARTDSMEPLELAIARRNVHEVAVHDYHHVALSSASWSFAQKFSRNGRSTITDRMPKK